MDYPSAYLDGLILQLKELELVFRIEFGLQLYLTWGTLLGAIREGDLIGHDFDIDVAYVSRARSKAGVLRERERIESHFRRFGRVIGTSGPGRFMVAAGPAPSGIVEHGLEIWTSFSTGGSRIRAPLLLPGNG